MAGSETDQVSPQETGGIPDQSRSTTGDTKMATGIDLMAVPKSPAAIVQALEAARNAANENIEAGEQEIEDLRDAVDTENLRRMNEIEDKIERLEDYRATERTAVKCLQFLAGEHQDYTD
jgi:predicted  nucleic acid-binding Zn-ribbon protein